MTESMETAVAVVDLQRHRVTEVISTFLQDLDSEAYLLFLSSLPPAQHPCTQVTRCNPAHLSASR